MAREWAGRKCGKKGWIDWEWGAMECGRRGVEEVETVVRRECKKRGAEGVWKKGCGGSVEEGVWRECGRRGVKGAWKKG